MANNRYNGTQSLIDWAGGPRAIVAVVFTDIRNSTALGAHSGDAQTHQIMEAHFKQSATFIERHNGRWVSNLGDGEMVLFKTTDEALDFAIALHACTGSRHVEIRAGIHVGTVRVLTNIQNIRRGAVNFAARVGSATKAAQIWVSDPAFGLLLYERAPHHQALCWEEHPDIDLKGLGVHSLWSLTPNGAGQTLAQIAAKRLSATASPPRAATVSNIPEGMVPRHFIGRENALGEIAAALEGGSGRAAITALHGLRGVGKTVLAAAYAERHATDYRATWWVRAETEAGLRADLVGLAVRLGWVAEDAQEEPALSTVIAKLRDEGDGILLIFDNARDPEALRPWLPRGGACRVIVTSNAPNWGRVATPVEIRVWPKETGGEFLIERHAGGGDRAAAEDLSEALGGLPLAHEMAAAYCGRTGMSFAAYAQRFNEAPAPLLDSATDAPEEYHDWRTVWRSFGLAIEAAAEFYPAAEKLIVHAALLAPEPIPLFLFTEGGEAFGEPLAAVLADNGLDEAVAALRAFALVDREMVPDERDPNVTTDTIRLHRLVRQVAAARIEGEARDAAARTLIAAIAAVYPRDVDDDPKTWPRARRVDALAMGLVGDDAVLPQGAEAAATYLMGQLAAYRYFVLGAYAPAEPLCRRALAIAEASFGSNHPAVAAQLNNLASLLRDMNRPGEAEPLYRRGLAISEASFGPDHPTAAIGLNNLAGLLQNANRLGEAEKLFRRALAIDETSLGPDHPTVAIRLGNLAGLLQETNRVAEAEPLCRRALAIHEARLPPDHPYVATGLNNLAALLRKMNRPIEAERLYRRALAIDEESLGRDHPSVATALNNLASLLRATNRLGEAEPLYRRALAILATSLGPDHPNTVMVRENLAGLLMRRE